MPLKRVILELGSGNDLHGGDYTKAAIRAVEDAIHHSSLAMIRTLGIDRDTVGVDVTIGVRRPDRVEGGLDIPEEDTHDMVVIASAAIAVRIDLP